MTINLTTTNDNTKYDVVDNEIILFAHSERTDLMNQGALTFSSDVSVNVPKGYIGLVMPLDNLFTKTSLIMPAAPQQVVSGEIIYIYAKSLIAAGARKFKIGDAIARVIFVPITSIEVTHVKKEERTVGA